MQSWWGLYGPQKGLKRAVRVPFLKDRCHKRAWTQTQESDHRDPQTVKVNNWSSELIKANSMPSCWFGFTIAIQTAGKQWIEVVVGGCGVA
jgi:hypothetical protein